MFINTLFILHNNDKAGPNSNVPHSSGSGGGDAPGADLYAFVMPLTLHLLDNVCFRFDCDLYFELILIELRSKHAHNGYVSLHQSRLNIFTLTLIKSLPCYVKSWSRHWCSKNNSVSLWIAVN